MAKHQNDTDLQPKTTKEQLKRLSIATVAALGLIGAVGAVSPPTETVSGQAVREVERSTSPLGYYFGGHRNNTLDLYTEDAGQRIIDYANLNPEKAFLVGVDKGAESTGVLHVRDGHHTVVAVSADREGDTYKLRQWGVILRGFDAFTSAELKEQTNEKNDAGNTWDVEVSTQSSVREEGEHLENNLEIARARKVPVEQLEEADRRTMHVLDNILDRMGI